MIDLPGPIRESSRFLRRLLLGYWVGATLLLSTCLSLIDLVERHREVIADAEHTRDLVASSLAAPMPEAARQTLIQNYAISTREDQVDGMNLLLVVNAFGRIVYTSRPSWHHLSIDDPLISQSETNDADFQAVVNCFRRRLPDCINMRSSDLQLRTASFTVVRPIQLPRRDLGLRPEQFLVIVNYDPGVVLADFAQDVLVVVVLSLAIAALLTLALWYSLSSRLLPRLTEASHTDGLTQLMNRSLFMEQAKELLADAEERKAEMVFAILDIDHFKRINDTFGHSCGDSALAHVAEIFRTVTRPEDLVCRFGGEEFALLLSGSRLAAGKALERLRLQLEMSRLSFAGHQLTLNASIGAAATAECGYNIDYLYTTADKALYTAKQAGRNRVEWSDGRMLSRLSR